MTDTTTIIEFIKSYSCLELTITNNENILTFTKMKQSYAIQLNVITEKMTFVSAIENVHNDQFTALLNNSKLNIVDQLPDLMDFIINLNPNNYCVICHDKLDFQSDNLVPCNKPKCLYKYEELIIGNNVIEKFVEDKKKCKFLLASAIDAMICDRKYDIFEPFPQYFLKNNVDIERGTVSKLTGKNYDNQKDFELINKTISGIDIDNITNIILDHKTKNDIDLANSIGKNLYILIRFILMSCKVNIMNNDNMLEITSTKYKLYKIVNPYEIEEEFKNIFEGKSTSFLYHGSKWCNWYSILRNGLKNCSNSKLMTAGAAFGAGIYLSDNIDVSFNYGLSGKKSVVGVFELMNKEKYHKGGNVYVVDDEKVLIQRYLLIIPQDHKNTFAKEINPLFSKQIHENKLNSAIRYNKKSIVKIMREYKSLVNLNPENSSFRIEMNADFPFEWKIFIGKFDDKLPIAQDMKKFNVKEIELEIKFPADYPFSVPNLRVVRPRFMLLTGHITSGGSICNEILTERGWSPVCSIEGLITLIISELVEGNARLDPQKYHIPYSLEEAKESFIRVAKSHGWM